MYLHKQVYKINKEKLKANNFLSLCKLSNAVKSVYRIVSTHWPIRRGRCFRCCRGRKCEKCASNRWCTEAAGGGGIINGCRNSTKGHSTFNSLFLRFSLVFQFQKTKSFTSQSAPNSWKLMPPSLFESNIEIIIRHVSGLKGFHVPLDSACWSSSALIWPDRSRSTDWKISWMSGEEVTILGRIVFWETLKFWNKIKNN